MASYNGWWDSNLGSHVEMDIAVSTNLLQEFAKSNALPVDIVHKVVDIVHETRKLLEWRKDPWPIGGGNPPHLNNLFGGWRRLRLLLCT